MIVVFIVVILIKFLNVRGDGTEITIVTETSILKETDGLKNDFRIPLCSRNSSRVIYESIPSTDTKKETSLSYTDLFCKNGEQIIEFQDEEFNILSNGSLFIISTRTIFDESRYCLQNLSITHSNYWTVNVCVSVVKIPRCCFMDDNFDSVCDDKIKTFDPPKVELTNTTIIFDGKTLLKYNLNCNNILTTPLKNADSFAIKEGKLAFISNGTSEFNFCIDREEEYLIKYCNSTKDDEHLSCQDKGCLRKCCPHRQIFDYQKNSCAFVDRKYLWHPTFHDASNSTTYLHGFPTCKLFPLNPGDHYFALTDGQMYVEKYKELYPNDRYCVDYFKSGLKITETVLLCFQEESSKTGRRSECKNIRQNLYPSLMVVSSICLALTLAVYSILPDLYRKINGKCVIASTSALLGAFITLIIIQWNSSRINVVSCQVLGLFCQFFSLSAIFWLNVMCFDVWRALRSQHSLAGQSPYSVNRRFIKYSVYAWGCPLIIGSVTALMQFHIQTKMQNKYLITPGFGKTGCFFPANDSKPFWAYFYGFILILMVANIFFFVHLLVLLHMERVQNDSALKRRNKRHVMWMKLYLKLFSVMGITYIFETVSWIEGSCKLWIWTDSINALRGLLIFGIFVCKKDIIKKLKNRSTLSMSAFKISLTRSSECQLQSSERTNSRFYVETETIMKI